MSVSLAVGLHRVHWKSGGSSLVAVGKQSDGRLWFAPCNWTLPSSDPSADVFVAADNLGIELPQDLRGDPS